MNGKTPTFAFYGPETLRTALSSGRSRSSSRKQGVNTLNAVSGIGRESAERNLPGKSVGGIL
jgi:hypothetical protein